jgi:hypothetical protein
LGVAIFTHAREYSAIIQRHFFACNAPCRIFSRSGSYLGKIAFVAPDFVPAYSAAGINIGKLHKPFFESLALLIDHNAAFIGSQPMMRYERYFVA